VAYRQILEIIDSKPHDRETPKNGSA
jgi:hypothetical protein